MVTIPAATMKALGHFDLQMTIYFVSFEKTHIRGQVEKLNTMQLLTSSAPRMKALLAPAYADQGKAPALFRG
jgi:hypothetical protein